MNKRLDILNLEWPHSDRDLHIVTATLCYLKNNYQLNFKTRSIFNGYYYLIKYKPKILIISNFQGSSLNHEIVKMAYLSGIKVITFISEGNISKVNTKQYLFGWNKDNRLYVDKLLLWSQKGANYFINDFPELKNNFFVTGGTGYDKYKILNFESKNKFIEENNLNFKKVIGIAAWGFDLLFGEYWKEHSIHYLEIYGENNIIMHRKDLYKQQKIYKYLIENNKDILFILRYHPGNIDFEKNEFYGLDKYENVFISNKTTNNQYQISDLINISDLWIGYETTTTLEAWLLDKQTFLINPSRSDFIRENVYRGSPIVKSEEEAQNLIDEYFKTGTMKSFEKLKDNREQIIKDVIEYSDGKNYIRAAKEIIEVYNKPDKEVKYGFKIYKEALKQILKLILSKTIFTKRWSELNYKSDFAKLYQDMYFKVINV